ncbi:MAG: cache domain-containing protein [Spirochaetaceae bacterium]
MKKKKQLGISLSTMHLILTLSLLLIVSTVIGLLWVRDKNRQFEQDIIYIRQSYIDEKQEKIKTQVDNAVQYIDYQKTLIESRLERELVDKINEATDIALGLYNTFNEKLSEVIIKELIMEALRTLIFFDGRGYIYVFEMDGTSVMHGAKPEVEGTKAIYNFKDVAGNYPLRDIIKNLKEGGNGFVNFYFFRPNSSEQEPKLSYNKIFKPYNWVIGTGEYKREVEREVQEETIRRLEEIRYDEGGYLFINSSEGISISHPISPNLEGTDITSVVDPTGKSVFSSLLRSSKSNSPIFVDYIWSLPETGKDEPKTSYARYIEEWDWVIGSGLYMHKIDSIVNQKRDELQDEIRESLYSILLIILFSLFIGFLIIRFYNNHINKSFAIFSDFFDKASNDFIEIDYDIVNYKEFQKLSILANNMLISRLDVLNKLKQSESFFQSIIDSSPIIFFVKDDKGKYIQVNKAYEKSAGREVKDIIGFTDSELYPIDKYKKWQDMERLTRESGKEIKFELTVPNPDKERTFIQFYNLVENKVEDRIDTVGWAIDVTDMKDTEFMLEQREIRLNALVSALPDMTFLKDESGVYLEAFLREDQIKKSGTLEGRGNVIDLVGKSVYDFFDKKIADRFINAIQESIEKNKIVTLEYELRSTIGLRSYEARIAPTVIDSGKKAVIWSARDITEIKQMTEELARAKEEAEAATKAKGDFLANMSHEIRTPMNAIIGLNHLLSRTELNDNQTDYVEKVTSSAKSLLGIINDILDFSKIEAGKMDIENIEFDINEVLDNLINMVGDKVQGKGLELIIDIDKSVPEIITGDPLRISQILLNFVSNAIKFTESGEIKIRCTLDTDDSSIVKFSVQDSGIGLSKDQQNRLFKAFSQADTSTTRKFGGTGLGLSISKHLAELMGGRVSVMGEINVGSTFIFTIKTTIVEDNSSMKFDIPDQIKNLNVIIVDDSDTVRVVISELVLGFDYRITAVSNGKEALLKLNEHKDSDPYDLVLTDYLMPDLNGIELASEVKKLLLENRPPVILFSAYNIEQIQNEFDLTFVDHVLQKPLRKYLLYNAILSVFHISNSDKRIAVSSSRQDNNFLDSIRGASILLVEDNEINQQVASELLQTEGFYVDVAENGQVGCDKVNQKEYDIVLMDLQMPVMGGLDATEIIRKDYDKDTLPIIAMTADAMSGVEERVKVVGMNDYVTKPIDLDKLWRVLGKWVKPKRRDLPSNYYKRVENENKDSEKTIPELKNIDTTVGLSRVGGNSVLYLRLLGTFRDEYNSYTANIKSAIKRSDSILAQRLAHTIKGVAGNIGATLMEIEALKVETAIKNSEDISDSLDDFDTALTSVITELHSKLVKETKVDNLDKKVIDIIELKKLCLEFKVLLENKKPKPINNLLETIKSYELGDLEDNFNLISASLKKYNFKGALKNLETILENL